MPISNRTAGTLFTAADYNELRNKINQVINVSSGDYGYGQASTTSAKTTNVELISASHMDELHRDILRARGHQTGADALQSPITGDLFYAAGGTYAKCHNAYVAEVNAAESNRLTAHSSQFVLTTLPGKSISNWNGTTTIITTVTWGSADAKRNWFNALGEIRCNLTMSGASSGKGTNWQSSIGTRNFTYSRSQAASAPYSMTYSTGEAGVGTGVYDENTWDWRWTHSATAFTLTATFNDNDVGSTILGPFDTWGTANSPGTNRYWVSGYDEPVDGTITQTISSYTPNGQVGGVATVVLPVPSVA